MYRPLLPETLLATIIVEPTPEFRNCCATNLPILVVELVRVFAPESEPRNKAFEDRSKSARGVCVNMPTFPDCKTLKLLEAPASPPLNVDVAVVEVATK
jgi:hypothetical protein